MLCDDEIVKRIVTDFIAVFDNNKKKNSSTGFIGHNGEGGGGEIEKKCNKLSLYLHGANLSFVRRLSRCY